jgi:hypothetical protein
MHRSRVLLASLAGVLVLLTTVMAATFRVTTTYQFASGLQTDSITSLSGTTGDSAMALPANSVGGAEVSGMPLTLTFCGQADENGTIYLSPTSGINGVDFADGADYSIAGTACDGLDGATEGTQDLVIFPEVAFKVMGMYCMTNGTLGASEALTLTLRSAAANVTPSVSCAVGEAATSCRSLSGTTTDVAAGAAVAVRAVQVSNNSDDDLWCQVAIMLQ